MTHRRGFTLIELLVVVSIIAVLAGLLLPIYSRARAKGYEATCMSTQRQIAQAVSIYAQDHDNTLMPMRRVLRTNCGA